MLHRFAPAFLMVLAAPALAQPAADPAHAYADNCARCHQLDGKGLAGAYPPLAGDPITIGPAAEAIRILLDGKGEMPGFRHRLSDAEMAAALSYSRMSWGNSAGPIDAGQFTRARTARK